MKNLRARVIHRRTTHLASALLFSLPAFVHAQQMPVYQTLDIGSFGGEDTSATSINDAGEVTGTTMTPEGWQRAFIYKNGAMIDLGTLKADRYGRGSSTGAAINNRGEVTGQSETEDGSRHAVLYSNGSAVDLGTLGGFTSNGYAINDAGQVSGISYLTGNGEYHAFLYSSGVGMKDLGTPGDSYSTADGLNDAGQVAGIYQLNFESHAYIYSGGPLVDLVPGRSSYVRPQRMMINAAGNVTGTYREDDVTRSFLARDGALIDLGALGSLSSSAVAVNDSDQITGSSGLAAGESHAFLWSAGEMEDLGTLGGAYSNGIAINESGQVTGQSLTADGMYHPFVYANGEMIDLGLPDGGIQGGGTAINANGEVSGSYQVRSGIRFPAFYSRGFIAVPISLLFSKLESKANQGGPIRILAALARVAHWYYNESDSRGTCAALKTFETMAGFLSYGNRARERTSQLISDAKAIESAIGCRRQMANRSDQSVQLSEQMTDAARGNTITAEDKDAALQWYRERFEIGANGALIEPLLTSSQPPLR